MAYININVGCDVKRDMKRDIKREIDITVKSLGLSSLFVTFRSDVIPNFLKRIIVNIGIRRVKSAKRIFNSKETFEFKRSDNIEVNTRESVTIFERKWAIEFFKASFFILISNRSIPNTRNIHERMSEVSK